MKGDIGNRGHMTLEFTVHRVDEAARDKPGAPHKL